MIKDLIKKNRSYRRFHEEVKISTEDLKDLVDLARLSPSGANLQPLKFMLSNEENMNKLIFKHLGWAAYLKDWDGPIEGERPAAYIVILGEKDPTKSYEYDVALACQSMLLGAVEKGLGGCIFASIARAPLSLALNVPENLRIPLIIAIGKPKEEVIIEPIKNNDVKYWRDEKGIHHVPKRSLEDLIVKF